MVRLIIIITTAFLLCGCSLANVERTITMPNKEVYKVTMRIDDCITFEKDGVKLSVDGRGRPGVFENVATMALTQTQFNLSNKEGR